MRIFRLLTLSLAVLGTAFTIPTPASAGIFINIGLPDVGISVGIGPPVLPVYDQPPCPVPDEIWTPGYWAYGPYGYYWVPGTWVTPPSEGLLWTPGYWGYGGSNYAWHPGYWAPQVGFYGGINYGHGYFGRGYDGGGWYGNHFRYNTAVTNVNTTVIRNVYENRTVINNYYNNRNVSYNGGPNGVRAVPTRTELAVARERHVAWTATQKQHVTIAQRNRNFLVKYNKGRPPVAAVARPLAANRLPAHYAPIPVARTTHAAPASSAYRKPTTVHAYKAPVTHATKPVTHYAAKPVTHYAAKPVTHYAAKPVTHYAAKPVTHYAAKPVTHYAAKPVTHYAPAPTTHDAARPAVHYTAPRPVTHYAARPATHYAAPRTVSHPPEHRAAPEHAPAEKPRPDHRER